MEIIKRKILLEEGIDREYNSKTWGQLTATNFYINIFLTQNVDDMGLFTDIEFIPKSVTNSTVNYQPLITKLQNLGVTFPFMLGTQPSTINQLTNHDDVVLRLPNKTESDYYNFGNTPITGNTDSKLEDVRSYSNNNPYRTNFNVSTETYVNYNNLTIVGVNRIKSMGEPKIYVFDAPDNINLGTDNQIYGIQYREYSGVTGVSLIDGQPTIIPLATFRFLSEGWNMTNTSLSALTKIEYLFGIISPPEVESDVFIDRGATSVMDMHLRLSEIKNLSQLENYGNGFYKLFKQ
jgi:hypothetical protein